VAAVTKKIKKSAGQLKHKFNHEVHDQKFTRFHHLNEALSVQAQRHNLKTKALSSTRNLVGAYEEYISNFEDMAARESPPPPIVR